MNELQSLSQVFQNKIFRIPDYQRGYAWQEAQLRDFMEDVIGLQEDRYHYTGLLSLKVLNKQERSMLDPNDAWLLKRDHKAYHVVDGQQRLTTFVILINEIIDFVCGLPENQGKPEDEILLDVYRIRDIREKYICRKCPPNEIITTYMFGYADDDPSAKYLKHQIFGEKGGGTIPETYYTNNLKHAKAFFGRELEKVYGIKGIDGIAELYRKLTLKLMFNIHEIEDDYDVFVAFETMNNRGKRLTNLELLKNRLIYLTTLYPKEILDDLSASALRHDINSAWSEVYHQLGRNDRELLNDDEFLRAHWIMYFAYSRRRGDDYIKFLLRRFSHKSILGNVWLADPEGDETGRPLHDVDEDEAEALAPELPETISGEFLQPGEIKDYVDSLRETAECWYYTFFPKACAYISEEERIWIDKLNRVGIGYFRPLVAVSLVRRLGISGEQRLAFLKAAERFIFIDFRMAMYQSSYKSSDYYRKTREVYTGNLLLAEVTEDLVSTTDKDAQDAIRVFVTKMNQRFQNADGFYTWYDLRYVLFEYEYTLAVEHKIEKLDWAVLSRVVRDHVTIEHILPQSPTKPYWQTNFRQFSDEEKRLLTASLGNLLPLSHSINSRLQNIDFDEKKERGYINGCHSEIEVSQEPIWDAQHIYDRGIKLLHFMETRWGFQFESPEQMDDILHIGFVKDGRPIPPESTVDYE